MNREYVTRDDFSSSDSNAGTFALAGGAAAQILNTTNSANGLANLAANTATGAFTVTGGANFSTVGNFSSAGTTTDNGTLTANGGVTISTGSLLGGGKITGNLNSSGLVMPGTSSTVTGTLTDAGTYTQNASGSLDIAINGTEAYTITYLPTDVLLTVVSGAAPGPRVPARPGFKQCANSSEVASKSVWQNV